MNEFYKEYIITDETTINKIAEIDKHCIIKSLKLNQLIITIDSYEHTARVDIDKDVYMMLDYEKIKKILKSSN